ncbi:uncharacterized protein LOC111260619 isoform X2 [Varroa jacobsoni]|uniref:Uncharacterized protein n=1 Tax=Varroa destructor TaxID=109461 RepID=A0A7M7MAI1_VARDE|nr:uncharacterized protein LOC111244768 isoform X2 [Varroa destructor]XP_022689253.1 uncharacterized protein LOC111260619 isoform X2 [Varroa jacobsoni]
MTKDAIGAENVAKSDSMDSECFAQAITQGRKYATFTSMGCTDLDNALHYTRMVLHEAYQFAEEATELQVGGCIVLVLYRDFNEYVMICYQDKEISVALIDVTLDPCMDFIIKLLNTATLSLWGPLELTMNLVSAFLVAYLDGSLEAKLKFRVASNSQYRVALEIRNHFVDNALVDVARDNHLVEGVARVEQSILKNLDRLNFQVPKKIASDE